MFGKHVRHLRPLKISNQCGDVTNRRRWRSRRIFAGMPGRAGAVFQECLAVVLRIRDTLVWYGSGSLDPYT
jgi:hypothetical protein